MSTAPGTVLELDLASAVGHRAATALPVFRRPVFVAAASVIVLLGIAACTQASAIRGAFGLESKRSSSALRFPLEKIGEVETMTVDDKSQIIVEGFEAEQRNAAIAISNLPVESAASFILPQSRGHAYTTALKCLAQAVYYEAAVEPIEGRRAVAQVVLNRVRSPLYPDSVCGVVYEGSQRTTGCQFSFTCDGSLLRAPMKGPWGEAVEVARQALAGRVETRVGTATNYHADYVLPKWAFTLAKIDKIGRHIFYRLHGKWGQRASFVSAYNGMERLPAINYDTLRARMLASGEGGEAAPVPGLTVTPAVTDRHAENDVGGRLDVTKEWRLTIPDPISASSKYRAAVSSDAPAAPASTELASATPRAVLAQ